MEDKLITLEHTDIQEAGKEIRIWMDGAFDMMHYGHMNAFRQGKAKGTTLIVGVNSDETITACKGKPVTCEAERIATVRGCKWVDEVVEGVPYIMSEEYLSYVIDKYKIDYVVHGDDPCIVDGKDVYESAKKMGKYLTIPRTEGISTTDIVGRMLLMNRAHHRVDEDVHELNASTLASIQSKQSTPVTMSSTGLAEFPREKRERGDSMGSVRSVDELLVGSLISMSKKKSIIPTVHNSTVPKSNFLTTSLKLRLFGVGVKEVKPSDQVVYLAGAWDMFHAGHIEILEKAKKMGSYVICGVHNDSVVNNQRGLNLPIMNLHERVLSVLGCKFVDDVLIDAPVVVTQEMICSLRVNLVLIGSTKDDADDGSSGEEEPLIDPSMDPYRLPRQLGLLRVVRSSAGSSVMDFVDRIEGQRERFNTKYAAKMDAEKDFYKTKYNL